MCIRDRLPAPVPQITRQPPPPRPDRRRGAARLVDLDDIATLQHAEGRDVEHRQEAVAALPVRGRARILL
eukprot:13601192-Alexandrium_andersonii.AAC.1